MSFNQFVDWCNTRACDGMWGVMDAYICMDIIDQVRSQKFWRRGKKWKELKPQIMPLVDRINMRINGGF